MGQIVYSIQKGKIPGPDGITIEFFQGFYDLVKGWLLNEVQESKRVGKVLGAMNSTFLSLIDKNKTLPPFKNSDEYHAGMWFLK